MDDNAKLQAQAVEQIEKEIKDAQTIKEERMDPMAKLRKLWENFTFKSKIGSWVIKVVAAVVVFISLKMAMTFGLECEGSLLNSGLELLAKYTDKFVLIITALEFGIPVLFIFWPMLGGFLTMLLLYASLASKAPIVLMLVFFMLLCFIAEDRAVLAMLIAMPVLALLTPVKIGLALLLIAGMASTRGNNGSVKSAGFMYLALIDLAAGYFGPVLGSSGAQIIPNLTENQAVAAQIKSLFAKLGTSENVNDKTMWQVLILLGVALVAGIVYSQLLKHRFSTKKQNLEIRDAIFFAVMIVIICIVPTVLKKFTVFTEFGYSYVSIALQVIAAYILTRPIAGRSPNRSKTILEDDKNFIFISYAHSDIERIKPYLKMLDKEGYEFWYDDSIKTGTEWQGVIASNLANCSCFLAFISDASITSDYCLKEINYATSKKKPMAVIMLDEVPLPPVLEMHLASLQAVQREKFSSDEDCMNKVFEMEQLKSCKY